jgi:tetratricopeptide (TPR) repeat protein
MSVVLSANEAFRDAAALFARGDASVAVKLLDQLALQHPTDWSLQRRVLSATGGCQIDAGQWRDAAARLDRAHHYARDLGDPVAQVAVLVNQTSLYMATWQYRAAIAATDGIEVVDSDSPPIRQEKAAALINRAQAALVLSEWAIAELASVSAYATLDEAVRRGERVNLIHLAAAGHCVIRVRLLQHDTERPREIIARLESLSLQERAMVHLLLAHAATLAELGNSDRARSMLRKLLGTTMPEGLRRDALFALLRIDQQIGDIGEALRLLTQLSDVVVSHRSAVLEDALDICEVTDNVLAGTGSLTTNQQTQKIDIISVFNSIARITEASETVAAYRRRLNVAAVAALFAVHIELGTRFACAIGRGVIMQDFGALSLGSVGNPSTAFADASLRSSLRIFERIGIARDTPEYRIAAFRYERGDGTGLLGVKEEDIPIEAQIAVLSGQYFSDTSAAATPCHGASELLAERFRQWIANLPFATLASLGSTSHFADSQTLETLRSAIDQ